MRVVPARREWGRTFYFADRREIWAYDYGIATGAPTNRRGLFAIHDLGIRGVPEPRFAG